MQKWGIIVSTYGNSEFRLTQTLKSMTEKTKIPFDLHVRAFAEDYWQLQGIRKTADKFGAKFQESFRWRHWEPSCAFQIVENEMLGFFKDDIIVGQDWLEAIDYFWTMNPDVPISQVGLAFVEAMELEVVGILKDRDDMWRLSRNVERLELNEIANKCGKWRSVHHQFSEDHPILSFGSCAFQWTIRRKDFFDWNGPYWVGPGDQSCIYGGLGVKNRHLPFLLCWPSSLHRGAQSTYEYCKVHGLRGLPDTSDKFWPAKPLLNDFIRRWGLPYLEFEVLGNQEMVELSREFKIGYNLNFWKPEGWPRPWDLEPPIRIMEDGPKHPLRA